MPSYRRSRRRISRSPRKLIWARASGALAGGNLPAPPALGVPAQTDLLAPFEAAYGAQLIGCTIKRIRGLYFVTGASGAGNPAVAGRATIHVTDQVDAAVRPLVAQDNTYDANSGGLDFMSFEPMHIAYEADGDPQNLTSTTAARIVDVRAQRKVQEMNQALVLRWSQRAGVAVVGPPTLSYDLSILVALP